MYFDGLSAGQCIQHSALLGNVNTEIKKMSMRTNDRKWNPTYNVDV